MPQLSIHAKIAIGWTLAISGGIYGFILSKRSVETNRREAMQVRKRMDASNTGEYEITSRF